MSKIRNEMTEMPHSTDVLSPQDLLAEVRKFISGAVRSTHGSNTLELARTSLSLLQNLPAARDAVLEYFCTVFSVCVNKHVRQIEVNKLLPYFAPLFLSFAFLS